MDTSAAILVSAGGIWAGIVMMAWSNWQRGRADKRRAEAEDNRHKEAMTALDTATKALSVLIERTAPRPGA